jgi:hypothetical protein
MSILVPAIVSDWPITMQSPAKYRFGVFLMPIFFQPQIAPGCS